MRVVGEGVIGGSDDVDASSGLVMAVLTVSVSKRSGQHSHKLKRHAQHDEALSRPAHARQRKDEVQQ